MKAENSVVQHADALQEILNRFPEVRWDRWTGWYEYPADDVRVASAFGWIGRIDGRHDFLVLELFSNDELGIYETSYVTSSAKYSAQFGERLGIDAETHQECRRVEMDLPGVENSVVLSCDGKGAN